MTHPFGDPDPPVPRLLQTLATLGHAMGRTPEPSGERSTLVLSSGARLDPLAVGVLLGAWRKSPGARLLVLSALGAHPDARATRLRELWALEENARATALPVLTLRLAPLVGPASPLWLRLRSRPRLPRGGRGLLQPVREEDAVETIVRALEGRAAWEGWYEVAGAEVVSLAELAGLAERAGPRLPSGAGAWEPPLPELAEHRLAEPEPWCDHFGLKPRPLSQGLAESVA